jgi:hypothetical protein
MFVRLCMINHSSDTCHPPQTADATISNREKKKEPHRGLATTWLPVLQNTFFLKKHMQLKMGRSLITPPCSPNRPIIGGVARKGCCNIGWKALQVRLLWTGFLVHTHTAIKHGMLRMLSPVPPCGRSVISQRIVALFVQAVGT